MNEYQQQQSGWEWQQFDDERHCFESFELASEYAGQPAQVTQRMLEDFDSIFMVSNGENI